VNISELRFSASDRDYSFLNLPFYLMGPSRKRARTKPPSEEEAADPPSIVADSTTTKPSIPEADKHSDVVNKEEDAPTPLKAVKAESSSSKQVRFLRLESTNMPEDINIWPR
jgi:hypothetical protein